MVEKQHRALLQLVHEPLGGLGAGGHSLEEAAGHRGVTMNTARSQLKQIFFKTGTSRQSEVVRLVLTGVPPTREA